MRASTIRRSCLVGLLGAGWGLLCSPVLAVEVPPGQTVLCVEGVRERIRVELARTPQERARGLMERQHLGEFAGMWFQFEEVQSKGHGFWMFNTRIPLDIAFLDRDGRVLSIHTMEPCSHRNSWGCPVYRSAEPYWSALELNAGFFARHGVAPGARISPANYAIECPVEAED